MENQIVVFELNSESFGVEIAQVESIIKMQSITQIPHMPGFVEGMINLRGKVMPVIDLRKRLGLIQAQNTVNTRIVVTEVNGKTMGFIVDGVSEVLRVPHESIEPLPSMVSSMDSDFLQGIIRLEDRLIIFLELKKILYTEENRSLDSLATQIH